MPQLLAVWVVLEPRAGLIIGAKQIASRCKALHFGKGFSFAHKRVFYFIFSSIHGLNASTSV